MNSAEAARARAALMAQLDYAQPRRWHRFPLAITAGIIACVVFLIAFTVVLEPRIQRTSAVEVTLIGPKELRKVQPKKVAPAPAKPASTPAHHLRALRRPGPRRFVPPPLPAPGTGSGGTIAVPSAPRGGEGEPGGTGSGEGSGIGAAAASSAHAIYAPVPTIPDDLRENVFSTVAVAHFVVDTDGTVHVTLTTPTPEPRLNEIILDTLRQWKFFPATMDGVAIASQFDVRIPISVE